MKETINFGENCPFKLNYLPSEKMINSLTAARIKVLIHVYI